MKDVLDIIAQKKPSGNEIHVARSFLTKILRNSMRYSLGFTIALLLTCDGFIRFMLPFVGSYQVNTFRIVATHGFFFFLVYYLSHQKVSVVNNFLGFHYCYCIRVFIVLACWKECFDIAQVLRGSVYPLALI